MQFPSGLTDEERVRFLYRAIKLLKMEHTQKGVYFRNGKISESDGT